MIKPRIHALIVAGGNGSRAGGEIPKQYQILNGKPVLWWTVQGFLRHPGVEGVQVVIGEGMEEQYRAALTLPLNGGAGLREPVIGGQTRQESVRLGLQALAEEKPDYVLIHDAARPMVSKAVIDRMIAALTTERAAIPALPVSDSLKRVEAGHVAASLERAGIIQVQTPQGFHFSKILALHEKYAGENLTDDAALCEAAGIPVAVVAGEARNRKITLSEDLAEMERMMGMETRVGQGFDVHRFMVDAARPFVTLCGVKIPHSHCLEGHSDADAGLHAVTDALLGAMGEGDIGQHFPPSDARWKNADSAAFLKHALKLLHEKGGRMVHADVTLICEAPKIGPHRAAMQARLAEILEVPVSCASVKATTTEKLGFTGRGEGLAAQAVVTIQLPGDME